MITKRKLVKVALPAVLHLIVIALRGIKRETLADLFESFLSGTEFGQTVYADYKANRPIEKKLTKALKSAEKSFIRDCKRQNRQPHESKRTAKELTKKFKNDLELLGLDHADLHKATMHPDSFRTWLIENTIDMRPSLTPLEADYYSQLVDATAKVYSTHLERTPNYTNEAIDDANDKLERILAHQTANSTPVRPPVIHTSKEQTQGILYGSVPQIVRYYTERYLNHGKASIEAEISSEINTQPGAHIVIVGPPGSGKTQMACNVANRFRHQLSDEWAIVAWLDASSPTQLERSIISLGIRLGLIDATGTDSEGSISRLFSLIPSYYVKPSLLIYDNVNNISEISNYIPNSKLLSLLITTRSDEGWKNFDGWTTYKLTEFDKNTAVSLIMAITNESDFDSASKIVDYTGGLPLTIGQIGATIQDDPSLSLTTYYTQFTTATTTTNELIKPIKGASHDKSADEIFLINIRDLLRRMNIDERAEAVRQLSALCYLSASGVPTRWLTQDTNAAAIRTHNRLVRSAIISESEDGTQSSIHRLYAQLLRNNWNTIGIDIFHACDLAEQTLIAVNVALSAVNLYSEVRISTQQCIEQYIALSNQEYSVNFLSRAALQRHLASVLHAADMTCQQPEALHLNDSVNLAIDRCTDKTTRSSLHAYYANILRFAGHHELALHHYSQAIGRLSLISRNRLIIEVSFRREQAHCLLMDHQPQKAISILERCRQKMEHRLGRTNIHTIALLAELGFAYLNINRFQIVTSMLDDASNMEIDAHDFFQLTTVCYARNVLGLAYISSGIHQNSNEFHHFGLNLLYRNLCIFQEHLPPEHTDSLSYSENLAWAFAQLDQEEKALKQCEILLKDISNFYGEHHSHALNVRLNIGNLMMNLRRFDEAKVVLNSLENELAGRLKPDSTVLANCRKSLGDTLFLLNEFSAALEVYEQIGYVGHSLPLPFRKSIAYDWYVLSQRLSMSGHSKEALRLGELARSLCECEVGSRF